MEEDPTLICPFEPSHLIFRSRMPYHLSRCSKQHPNVKKARCIYDACHLVDSKDYEQHVQDCPSRENSFQLPLDHEDPRQNPTVLPVDVAPLPVAFVGNVERWAVEDSSASPLNNVLLAHGAQYGTPLIGASKKQRQKHRFEGRLVAQQEEGKENDFDPNAAACSQANIVQNNIVKEVERPEEIKKIATADDVEVAQAEIKSEPENVNPDNLNFSELSIKDATTEKNNNEKTKTQGASHNQKRRNKKQSEVTISLSSFLETPSAAQEIPQPKPQATTTSKSNVVPQSARHTSNVKAFSYAAALSSGKTNKRF